MSTRDQQRAALAYKHVHKYVGDDDETKAKANKYASIVYALPALLQTAGLCQALHFARSRRNETQKTIVDDLAEQLHRVNPTIPKDKGEKGGDALLKRAREANLAEYLQLTDEAMACAAWYRRLVQGVLKIDASDAEKTE